MKLALRQTHAWMLAALVLWLLYACVTVNIYFPAAEANQAAESFVKDVIGEPPQGSQPPPAPQGFFLRPERLLAGVLDLLVPVAQAQNFNIDTPAIQRLKSAMSARHRQLAPYFDSGALGYTGDGLLAIRDPGAIPLKDRPTVNRLVQQENVDRNALYREIAVANGHPEWESQVRSTWARQWIDNARPGWWVEGSGGWRRR